MGQLQDFLAELTLIETKYWKHFRNSRLAEEYIISTNENELLTFEFKEQSKLPAAIKSECMEIFKKYHK